MCTYPGEIYLSQETDNRTSLLRYLFPLLFLFMITPADAQQSELLKGLKVALSKAEGEKCPRCWHYTTDIGKVAEHAEICGRCVSNVAGDGEQRKFA